MKLDPVKSSSVAATGYEAKTNTMHVRFKSGGTVYSYPGVTPEQYQALVDDQALVDAKSIGKHLHKHFRNR